MQVNANTRKLKTFCIISQGGHTAHRYADNIYRAGGHNISRPDNLSGSARPTLLQTYNCFFSRSLLPSRQNFLSFNRPLCKLTEIRTFTANTAVEPRYLSIFQLFHCQSLYVVLSLPLR